MSSIGNDRSWSLLQLLNENLIDLVLEEQDSDVQYVADELKISLLQLQKMKKDLNKLEEKLTVIEGDTRILHENYVVLRD